MTFDLRAKLFREPSALLLIGIALLGLSSLAGCQSSEDAPQEQDPASEQKTDDHSITIVILGSTDDRLPELEKEINKEFGFLELGEVTFRYAEIEQFLSEPIQGDLVFYPPMVFGELIRRDLIRKVPDYLVRDFAQTIPRHRRQSG